MKGKRFGKNWSLACVALLTLCGAASSASAGQRALPDFTSQQGAFCAVFDDQGLDCAKSYYGGPDCADGGNAFTFLQYWGDPKNGYIAGIDVLGQLELNWVTTVNGSVSESPRPDGRANVNVLMHSTNALSRAFTFDADGNSIPLFGYEYFEVADGAPPTLGDAFMQVKFMNTASGAPLPDLFQLLNCPAPGQAPNFLSISAQASGPLRAGSGVPEGTPGRLEVSQTGPFATSGIANPHSKVFNTFPAANVIIRQTGH